MLVVWGRNTSASHLLSGNRGTTQTNTLPYTHLSKHPQTLHAQSSTTPAIQWTEAGGRGSPTCRDPFSPLLPPSSTPLLYQRGGGYRTTSSQKQSSTDYLLQCGRRQRVGCRTGVVGSTILLHNLLSQEFLVFQVAVRLWELCGAHEQVFSKKRKPCVCQPILWVSFRQFFLYVPPANKLSGHLNDLMREIQILRQIYHLCSIRAIGRTIPSPWVSVPLRKPTPLEKGLMAC